MEMELYYHLQIEDKGLEMGRDFPSGNTNRLQHHSSTPAMNHTMRLCNKKWAFPKA